MVCYFSEHKWLGSIYLFCFLGAQVLPKVQHYHYNLLSFKGQFSSVAHRVWLFAIPWTTARQASLSITNSWSPHKLMSIESVMPSNHLILCRPLQLLPSIFPSLRVLSNESLHHIRWPKYWSFNFSISPSSEYSELISHKIDWFDVLAVQGNFRSLHML